MHGLSDDGIYMLQQDIVFVIEHGLYVCSIRLKLYPLRIFDSNARACVSDSSKPCQETMH